MVEEDDRRRDRRSDPDRTPLSTYRLQLLPSTTLGDAAHLLDYLDELGVTHLYLSPILEAAPGSTHGYDVVDHGRVSRPLGGAVELRALAAAAQERGMGLVVDIVPNHMSTRLPDNAWLDDVLANGRLSRYAHHFDLDWGDDGRILLPVLGDHYGTVLEAGELRLRRHGPDVVVTYADRRFPIGLPTLADLLARAGETAGDGELPFLAAALDRLLEAVHRPAASRGHLEVARTQLEALLLTTPTVADAVDAELRGCNADADRLHRLLERQAYRLAHWRLSSERLGYRRFFDVGTLIGLRVEDRAVFEAVHELVVHHFEAGLVDGIRVDHPDGLRRPGDYLEDLRRAAPGAWIVVEKILGHDEELRGSWPVDGTTGYEHLAVLGGLFVDPAAEAPFTELLAELTGETRTFDEVAAAAKREILDEVLGAELARVLEEFAVACAARRTHRDVTADDRRAAVVETLVALDVYRTYVGEGGDAEPADLDRIDAAVARARTASPGTDPLAFDLLRQILRGEVPAGDADPRHRRREQRGDDGRPAPAADTELRMRFQQLSGPVMAKAVEDTAAYRYARLVARNDVGVHAGTFASDPEHFHDACRRLAARWPTTMVTTSTHDTKRGEDVRARLAVLSERPDRWSALVRAWFERHDPGRTIEPDLALLLYQTVVGAHPIGRDRLLAYATKASREAKRGTSWVAPDESYDRAVAGFVDRLAADDRFQLEVEELVAELHVPWATTSLAQKLLALTMPGVPDLYQGSELWDLQLVDPDNRRPVDFEARRTARCRLDRLDPAEIWSDTTEGQAKQWVCQQALRLRRARPETFGHDSGYRRLPVAGAAADHLVAFARTDADGDDDVVVLVPRLVIGLDAAGGWRDTTVELPPGRWSDELTGRHHDTGDRGAADRRVAELLATAPVALLARWRGDEDSNGDGRDRP